MNIPINFKLKVLVIADTHDCLTEEDLVGKDADVCVLLGDISGRDMQKIKRQITTMPIYGVLGDHDGWDLYERHGIENIHGKVVEVRGVKIAGLQGSVRYKSADYPLYTDEESCQIAESMDAADILISHDSPKYFHGNRDFAHSGLRGITDYCCRNNVPLNLHGHHHWEKKSILDNGTLSMCCHKVMLVDTEALAASCAEYDAAVELVLDETYAAGCGNVKIRKVINDDPEALRGLLDKSEKTMEYYTQKKKANRQRELLFLGIALIFCLCGFLMRDKLSAAFAFLAWVVGAVSAFLFLRHGNAASLAATYLRACKRGYSEAEKYLDTVTGNKVVEMGCSKDSAGVVVVTIVAETPDGKKFSSHIECVGKRSSDVEEITLDMGKLAVFFPMKGEGGGKN